MCSLIRFNNSTIMTKYFYDEENGTLVVYDPDEGTLRELVHVCDMEDVDEAERCQTQRQPKKKPQTVREFQDHEVFPTSKSKSKARGGRKSKLDEDTINEARGLLDSGMSYSEVAKRLGVGQSTLYTALPRRPKA